MKRNNRWIALGLVLAGAAVAFTAASLNSHGDTLAQSVEAVASAVGKKSHGLASARDLAGSGPEAVLSDNALRTYSLEVHNDFRQDTSDPSALGMLLGFDGRLTMGEVERTDTLSWLYLHPHDLTFTADGNLQTGLAPEQRALLLGELAQGFFAGRNGQGQIVEYRFSRPLSSLSQGFLRLIAVATQRVLPEDGRMPSQWTVAEVDTAGEAQVSYVSSGPLSFRKSKTTYTKLLTEAGLVAEEMRESGRTLEGAGTLEMDGDAIKSASLEEHSSLRIDKATITNDAEVHITAKNLESEERVEALRALLRRLPSVSALTLPVIRERPAQERFREILGDRSFDDLTQALATLDPEDEGSRRTLLQRLEADLNVRPSDAARLAERIGKAKEAEQTMIVSALSNAETPQATSALRGISQDPELPDGLRETATALLGFTKDADEETIGRLEKASLDPQDPQTGTATLALGNAAELMRTSSPERADDIVTQLLERLRAAGDEDTQVQLLAALGNSGASRLVEDLVPWMASPSAAVRAGAFRALRLIGSEAALATMAKGALGDADPEVRARVIAGLTARPMPGTMQVAVTVLQQEKEASVRLEALGVLGMLPLAMTEGALKHTAQSDPDADVRASALGLLKRDA